MFLTPKSIGAIAIAILLAASHWAAIGAGKRMERAAWEKKELDRRDIEITSIQDELQAQEIIKAHHELEKQQLKKGHADEIAQSRALSAAAPGLRISAAVCDQFATQTDAGGAGASSGGNPATRLVSQRTDEDFRALELKIETIFAGCRTGQVFLENQGMLP